MGESDKQVDRRAVLRTLGIGAAATSAAVVGGTALARPAAADDGDPVLLGDYNSASNSTLVNALNDDSVMYFLNNGEGAGIRSLSTGGDGVVAIASATNKAAVRATTTGVATSVFGSATGGYGVDGSSGTNHGVVGRASAAGRAAVRGIGSSSAAGVQGTASTGPGIDGSSAGSVGGSFSGATAAVRLVPQRTTGPPTSGFHQRGELLVDATGALLFCKTDGTPGTWKKVKLGPA